jgi:ABC-type maltose transport system permease subunit
VQRERFLPANVDWDSRITDVKLRTLPVGLSTFITGDVYGWGYLMAGAVLTTLPVIVAYIYLQRYMVEGLTAGSVKGS